jgi:hypothetical protein
MVYRQKCALGLKATNTLTSVTLRGHTLGTALPNLRFHASWILRMACIGEMMENVQMQSGTAL